MLPQKLNDKLKDRKTSNAFRTLGDAHKLIDFSSNDYLGFSVSEIIFDTAHRYLVDHNLKHNGATGSRLLSGNHKLYTIVEDHLNTFHNSEASLIYNSGYDANIGLFSSVPQRNDIILYDEYIHASIRDGITMSKAKAYKFEHNNLDNLERLLEKFSALRAPQKTEIYVVTESVFSMDGDTPDLPEFIRLCNKHNALSIIDEAHAIGVFGDQGVGLVQHLNLEQDCFARIVTFGKALGCHGAAILGNTILKEYLTNFSRSFIYTTALPPHTLATLFVAYDKLKTTETISQLKANIRLFQSETHHYKLQNYFIPSHSAIQSCIISGNDTVKAISQQLYSHGFDVKAVLSPTVPEGKERLRFCLHSYNSQQEISEVLSMLATFVS